MKFKEFIKEQLVTEKTVDPPMLIQLRRLGIRNYPRGERVALYYNPQLGVQLAIPYDYNNGKLLPSNMMPVKEELDEETARVAGVSRYGNNSPYVKFKQKQLADKAHKPVINDFGDWYEHMEKKHGEGVSFKMHNAGATTSAYHAGKHLGSFHHDKHMGTVGEEVLDEAHRIRVSLSDPKQTMVTKRHDQFTKTATVHTADPKRALAIAHDHYTKKGYKVHDAWHLDNFKDAAVTGNPRDFANEEVILETPMQRIHTILKTGKEDQVIFKNGAAARVHPVTAKAIHGLWHKVNSGNKNKLSELINSSPEGMVRVAKFADSLTAKEDK